jgi:hypothetical protein
MGLASNETISYVMAKISLNLDFSVLSCKGFMRDLQGFPVEAIS